MNAKLHFLKRTGLTAPGDMLSVEGLDAPSAAALEAMIPEARQALMLLLHVRVAKQHGPNFVTAEEGVVMRQHDLRLRFKVEKLKLDGREVD